MKLFKLCFILGLIFTSAASATVTVQIIANSTTGQIQDSTAATLPDGSLMRVGFFDIPALTSLTPSELLDYDIVNPLFTEFVTFTSASGNFLANDSSLPATNVGDQVYLWVFDSPTAPTATEYGIFTSTLWLSPADTGSLNMVSSAINTITVGSTAGSSPTNYLLTPVPEPAHFALLLGSLGLGVILLRRHSNRRR
ncbi:MAG: PEP-CTERM sorting domain-containing protein [Oceanipulchritudo sp.]